jgi:hypothetical protein
MTASAETRCKMRGLIERALELHASCPQAAPPVLRQLLGEALYRLDFPETTVETATDAKEE